MASIQEIAIISAASILVTSLYYRFHVTWVESLPPCEVCEHAAKDSASEQELSNGV